MPGVLEGCQGGQVTGVGGEGQREGRGEGGGNSGEMRVGRPIT